jgi:hypothetical protein
MVLLVTSSPRAQECAEAITKATGNGVQVASTLGTADAALRTREYAAVVLDQVLYDAARQNAEAVLRHAGNAVPLLLNFGICGPERVVVELRATLRRTHRELRQARHVAASQLRSELMDAVTGILLSSELALKEPSLPAAAAERLRSVQQLAAQMRVSLEQGR